MELSLREGQSSRISCLLNLPSLSRLARRTISRADSFAFEQDKAELRACIAELKSQMLILSEMQEISIRNIL